MLKTDVLLVSKYRGWPDSVVHCNILNKSGIKKSEAGLSFQLPKSRTFSFVLDMTT